MSPAPANSGAEAAGQDTGAVEERQALLAQRPSPAVDEPDIPPAVKRSIASGEESSTSKQDHEEYGECRICQEDDLIENLETPCKCDGTVKYAHHDCVQKWINEKGNITCEICNADFKGRFSVPEPPELQELRIEALSALPLFGRLQHRLFARDGMAPEEREVTMAASGQRLSFTYCFTIMLLILGMLMLHRTFGMIEEKNEYNHGNMPIAVYNHTHYGHQYPSQQTDLYSKQGQGLPGPGASTDPDIPEPRLDMGVVLLWLVLRVFVVILPLVVMMRVLAAFREARYADYARDVDSQAAAAGAVHRRDMAAVWFQHMEEGRYPGSAPVAHQRGSSPTEISMATLGPRREAAAA